MKKRILGLALALILIISLLPLTAYAADPAPRYLMYDKPGVNLGTSITESSPVYVVFQNVLDTDGTTVLGTKPVRLGNNDSVPSDNYLKFEYANGVVTITLKNINYKRTGDASYFIRLTNVSGGSNAFDAVIKLEGTNTIEASANVPLFSMEQAGNLTIEGPGSLTANVSLTSPQFLISSIKGGNLLIQNTSITAVVANRSDDIIGGIVANGDITIDKSTVDISGNGYSDDGPTGPNGANLAVMCTGEGVKTSNITNNNITIKNGSNVTLVSGKTYAVRSNGKLNIENSTVELLTHASTAVPFAYSVPYVTGCNTVQMKEKKADYMDFASFELAAGDALTGNEKGFKTVHEHTAVDKDGDCTTAETCACGKEITPVKQHIAGTKNDCTKNTPCGNEGCTKDYAQDALTAHVPGQDDNNCATPVKCTNPGCEADAIEAKAHEPKEGTYTCDQAHPCKNCGENYRNAGEHVGGGTEATCQKKAVCSCGEAYGELAACKPAADDGDCTTAVKCSVCGKETTKAQTAHKYTDKKDTTCDNAGCTNTRKVEGTENPKTGDNTALVLMVSLMATAAAAFVCTKKFVR